MVSSHADHLGPPRAITRASDNAKVWEWRNDDPFGNNPPNEDPASTGTSFRYNLRFPGQIADSETGTYQNYYRDYDPTTGRYPQSDPIGLESGSLNTYSYVGGDPISFIDPDGLMEIYRDGNVTIHSYPGPQAGGIEHARQGPGGDYHVHIKDGQGREVRISTEKWKPLTPEDQRIFDRSKEIQKTCEKLTDGEKKLFDRINRQIFHRGMPTINQILRIGEIRGGRRGVGGRGEE